MDPLAMGAEETESRDVVMGREWWNEEGVKAELPLRQDATDRAATTLDDNFIVSSLRSLLDYVLDDNPNAKNEERILFVGSFFVWRSGRRGLMSV